MAAGSVNTTRLLLRAKHTGTVPGLPDTLGQGWGSNGDRIYVWSDPTANFGKVQGGPVVYDTKQWDDLDHAHTIIQASIPRFRYRRHVHHDGRLRGQLHPWFLPVEQQYHDR